MSKIEDRVRKVADKIYDKTLGPRVAKMTLEQQVQGIKKFMRFPGGMPRVRKDLLEGLPTDIKEKAGEGMPKEQIKDYYWGCESFRNFWQKDLEMDEAILDELIRSSFEDKVAA